MTVFLKIGHRGARAYETENTIAGFKKAIELGADAIELDVRKSKDGYPVVIHDDNLKRVFGKDVDVNDASLSELKKLSAKKIPTLGEALKFIGRKAEKILLELKEPGCEKKVLDAVKKERLEGRAIIISFHEDILSAARKLNEKVETGLIYARHKNPVETALRLNAQYLVALYRFVHTKDIEKAHGKNLKILVWTVNTKREFKKYLEKGVDGIASDKPDIF